MQDKPSGQTLRPGGGFSPFISHSCRWVSLCHQFASQHSHRLPAQECPATVAARPARYGSLGPKPTVAVWTGPHRSAPVRGPLEGRREQGAGCEKHVQNEAKRTGPPRGPQRCGLVRPKIPSPPAPLPETVRGMVGEGRGKRYGGWHGIAARACHHPSAPPHNHDRFDPPAAQRFSAIFSGSPAGAHCANSSGKTGQSGLGRLDFSRIPRAPNNHFPSFRCI